MPNLRVRRSFALLVTALLIFDLAVPATSAWAQEQEPQAVSYQRWTPWLSTLHLPSYYFTDDIFRASYPTGSLRLPMDPRVMQVKVNPDSGLVTTSLAAADVSIGGERTETFDEYADRMTQTNLRKSWVKTSRERINRISTTPTRSATGLSIALPVQLPGAVQSVLGRGAPSINVSGSERISISGRSNWTNQENVFGRGQSLFPQLDMRQDLQINLSGSMGDKVNIDVAQSSGAQTSLANRVALRYNGYEDEVLRRLQLGNTQLTLPGTQYVSYSGRNDGLFGVMTEARLGSTELSFVASKQEARSERTTFVGTSLTRTQSVDDWQYIERTYFLLQFPDSMVTSDGEIRPDAPRIIASTVKVFVDDNIDQNLEGEQPGYAELRPPRLGNPVDPVHLVGKFDRKEPIRDYEIRLDLYGAEFPVLVLNSPVREDATLAVMYTDTEGEVGGVVNDTLRMQMLKAPESLYQVIDGRFTSNFDEDPLGPTREYELRSFYFLGSPGLDPQTTEIQVRRLSGGGQLEFVEQYTDPTSGANITYVDVTGVDLLDQTQGGTPIAGQDGRIDQFTNANWADWERGIFYLPDLRPFAPRLERPGDRYFAKSRAEINPRATRSAFLSTDPDVLEALRANPDAYDLRNDPARRDARTFTIFVEFSSSSGTNTIILRNTPVYDNSETVTVNGETLVRDRDYTINYQTGIVELISDRARAGGGQLSIDYSYAPLFAQANKTLIGSNLGLINRPNLGLGAAFVFESRGQQERRPRLGEEPTRTMIGDINGRFNITPGFMTSLVNLLPFYRGRDESRLRFSGEFGHSIPNPNTRNEVYIDDFEGTRLTVGAAMDARSWSNPAPPEIVLGAATVPVGTIRSNAELKWYNPFNIVRESDLRPNLTRAEDANAPVSVLSWWIPQKWSSAPHDSIWVGLTQTLDAQGADLSRSQFIDLWINDFRDFTYMRKPGVRFNIDIGIVSEDAQNRVDQLPNGQLDTEDQEPRDRQLDATEDTGIDSLFSVNEGAVIDNTVRLNASDSDPRGDDWVPPDQDYENERDPRRWRFNNGQEFNQNYRAIPDTEDLDGDGRLDIIESIFRYSFDLTDTTFLDTDVYEQFAGDPSVPNDVAGDNGWRRYLIPLDASTLQTFGNPDFHNIKHIRVWLDGMDELPPLNFDPAVPTRPLFEIAQIDIVGNRWVPEKVDSTAAMFGQKLVVRTVNNREDQAVYEPPFQVDTQNTGGSTIQEREQSLGLRAVDIVPGGRVSAFRTTTLPENYSLYESIRFYLAALDFAPEDSVRFFMRFISDSNNLLRNYYEYSAPIPAPKPLGDKPVPWVQFELPLTDFSTLKAEIVAGDTLFSEKFEPSPFGGIARLSVVGTPSFTRIQRIELGLINGKPPPADSTKIDSAFVAGRTMPGEIWVDELRAFNVEKDQGTAGRVNLTGNFSDLMTFNFAADVQDENFIRLGQSQGTGNSFLSTRFSGAARGEKVIGGLGFQIPINLSLAKTRSIPKFITGQDIRLPEELAEEQKTESWSRTINGSIGHSGSRGFLLRNSLDALSFAYSWTEGRRISPTSTDTSRVLSGRAGYSLSPSSWFSLPMPIFKSRGQRTRINILPTSTSIGFSMSTRRSIRYDLVRDGSGNFVSRNGLVYSKTQLYTLSAAWNPISILSYSMSSIRNANIPGIDPLYIGNVNFGSQTNFNQRIDLRIPIRFGPWISPDFDAGSAYTEARTPELSSNLTVGNFNNTTTLGGRWTFPFRRLAGAPQQGAADSTKGGGFSLPIGKILSKFGDIQTRANYTRNTAYNRLTGYPTIAYRMGIERNPGFITEEDTIQSVFRTPQSTETSQRNLTGEIGTSISLWGRAVARVRANYSQILRTNNRQSFIQQTLSWPDLTVDWGPVQRLLFLWRVFPTLTANSRFTVTTNEDGIYNLPISSRTVNRAFQPLINLSGTTKSGVQTSLSVDYTTSLRQDFRNSLVSGQSTDSEQNSIVVRGNTSKTFSPGSRLSLFGLFGSTLRSSVTLSANASLTKRTGGTKVPGLERIGAEVNNDRIEMQGTGTYTFSQNISGGLTLAFSQFRDFTRTVTDSFGQPKGTLTQRSIRLEASATMRF